MISQKVALVIGASRGIGRQIAVDLAKNGYAVIVSAKSVSDASQTQPFPPDPNSSSSTISTVCREILESGGTAVAIPCDVRDHTSISSLITQTISIYGRIDVLIYNSGAIYHSSVLTTPLSRYMLMESVNPNGLYASIQSCIPAWKSQNWNARIVVICPPIYSRFFRGKTAYAMGKVGMSVLVQGLGMDFARMGKEGKGMAVTGLWPASAVESAATAHFSSPPEDLRHPSIFSDAVLSILKAPVEDVNGLLILDEDYLRNHDGVVDFSKYALVPGTTPRRIMPAKFPDLSVEEQDDEGTRMDSAKKEKSGKLSKL
ncbi:short chain dehydrogenase family protein [Sclerotinia borealis F-4128]|uniref:Short chain dehydrogenase family protein n=1 Tax=Sclerotinia borealis (strain F-4128) TaxID=1432307 RepID=W9CT43_SCLBF|nr:short chain dehydrogenase family protein [Sclerotinia borealis F-4128]